MTLRHLRIHGHDIAYRKEGRGPVLVLLHGMARSSETWRHVVPIFASDFTVVAPDLLGHGESSKPRADYSLGAHATTVRDLLSMLGHDRATIVGQSWGGGVAMQLAYQFPDRCDRLVLVGSGGLGLEVNAILRALSVPGAALALPIGCRPMLRVAGEKVCAWLDRRGKHPSAQAIEIWRAYASLTDADTRRAFLATLRSVVDHVGQRMTARDRWYLAEELPTLIVWGDADPIIPMQHALDAHAAIRGSRLEIFEGAGHFPHCEDPVRFARIVGDFIRNVPAADVTTARWRELLSAQRSA
jgi:pimeloyl-ACP methyl ester carboxylesterase